MRIHSTPLSAVNLEPTWLAILETVFSIFLFISISLFFDSFNYLISAIVIAPLMLFVTDKSLDWVFKTLNGNGINLNDNNENKKSRAKYLPIRIVYSSAIAALVGVGMRIFSVVLFFIKNPLDAISSMPSNWIRQCLCIDLYHPPELIPSESVRSKIGAHDLSFYFWQSLYRSVPRNYKPFLIIYTTPFWLIGYLPSIVYRFTFKATSLVYLPFIFAARLTIDAKLSGKERLERFTHGELEKVRRAYSWIVIVALLTKFLLLMGYINLDYLNKVYLSKKFVSAVIMPTSFATWQMTLGVDALLTFFLLFYADAALARLEPKKLWKEETVLSVVSVISFIRAAVGIVTVSILFSYALKYLTHH